jgi:hypothetical protein
LWTPRPSKTTEKETLETPNDLEMAPKRHGTPNFVIDTFFLRFLPEGHNCLRAQIDTGAQPLMISQAHVEALGYKDQIKPYRKSPYYTVNYQFIPIVGELMLTWCPLKTDRWLQDCWLVVENLPHDVIIGRDGWYSVLASLDLQVLGKVNSLKHTKGNFKIEANDVTPLPDAPRLPSKVLESMKQLSPFSKSQESAAQDKQDPNRSSITTVYGPQVQVPRSSNYYPSAISSPATTPPYTSGNSNSVFKGH